MDLRQAHTILTAAAALETTGLGIELHPFDHNHPGNRDAYGDDYMTGCAEYTDAQGSRIYNIDLYPGPERGQVTARVENGLAGTGYVLLHESVSAATGPEQFDDAPARTLAGRVATVIQEYEERVDRQFARIAEREA